MNEPNKEPDLEFIKTINFSELKENDVIVLRVNNFNESTLATINLLSKTYGELMKNKKCTFLIMSKDSDINTISEAEMNKIGYYKREDKRIIT